MEERSIGEGLNGLSDYGDRDIPIGLRLNAYPLHTCRWRQAFLDRLAQVGYVGLIEASARVYDLLLSPKHYRCAVVAKLAGVEGSGKQAIYCALKRFLDDFLEMRPIPATERGQNLEEWHKRVLAHWHDEEERQRLTIISFADILNGHEPSTNKRTSSSSGELLIGPWSKEVSLVSQPRPSMAEAAFVISLLESMVEEARHIFRASDMDRRLANLVDRWVSKLSPSNSDYDQSFSPEGLSIFLRIRGYGNDAPVDDFRAPIAHLVRDVLTLCMRVLSEFYERIITAAMRDRRIRAAIKRAGTTLVGYRLSA